MQLKPEVLAALVAQGMTEMENAVILKYFEDMYNSHMGAVDGYENNIINMTRQRDEAKVNAEFVERMVMKLTDPEPVV